MHSTTLYTVNYGDNLNLQQKIAREGINEPVNTFKRLTCEVYTAGIPVVANFALFSVCPKKVMPKSSNT